MNNGNIIRIVFFQNLLCLGFGITATLLSVNALERFFTTPLECYVPITAPVQDEAVHGVTAGLDALEQWSYLLESGTLSDSK